MKKVAQMISFALICVLMVSSCDSKDGVTGNKDYLIFGHFYGMCRGDGCIAIFKLEKEKLFEDTKDIYPSQNDFYAGKYVQLSHAKYEKAKDLLDYFPADLLSDNHTVFGLPDATDGGGLYIEYNFDGMRKFWIFDNMKRDVPSKYHEFMDKVNETIQLLLGYE
jgi:hypothetical protein